MTRKISLGLLVVVLLSLLLLVVGCSRKVAPSITIAEKEKDSSHTEIRYRDVPVPVPGEKVIVHDTIDCDKVTNKPKATHIKAKSGKSFVDVDIHNDGSVTASGGCDSLKLIIQAKDSVIAQYHTTAFNKTETKVVTEYINHWYDAYCRGISILVLLTIAIYILQLFLKFKNLI